MQDIWDYFCGLLYKSLEDKFLDIRKTKYIMIEYGSPICV